jgi:hypothetical protein
MTYVIFIKIIRPELESTTPSTVPKMPPNSDDSPLLPISGRKCQLFSAYFTIFVLRAALRL